MNRERIVAEIDAEISRLSKARAALTDDNPPKRRPYRRRKMKRGGHAMSAATRKKISAALKNRPRSVGVSNDMEQTARAV